MRNKKSVSAPSPPLSTQERVEVIEQMVRAIYISASNQTMDTGALAHSAEVSKRLDEFKADTRQALANLRRHIDLHATGLESKISTLRKLEDSEIVKRIDAQFVSMKRDIANALKIHGATHERVERLSKQLTNMKRRPKSTRRLRA